MKKNLLVGTGFFKKSLTAALKQASEGDSLILDPGEYDVNQGITVSDVRIIGNGRLPTDVVIHGRVSVGDTVSLENLTVKNEAEWDCDHSNTCLSASGAHLTAANCIFEAGKGENVGLYIDNATVDFHACTIKADEVTGLAVGGGGQANCDNCQIERLWVFENSKAVLNADQVLASINVEDESVCKGTTVYLDSDSTQPWMQAKNGGQILIDQLNVPEGVTTLYADHGLIQMPKTNANTLHRVFYQADTQSTVSVSGAEVKL